MQSRSDSCIGIGSVELAASAGAVGERAAGNGAAMRIAPLAFFLDPDDPTDRQTLADVCRITHRHDEAYIGALAIVRVMKLVMRNGADDLNAMAQLIHKLPDSRVRDRIVETHVDSVDLRQYAAKFGTTGYVVDSVPCAIVAAIQFKHPLEMIQAIVECGGDTDTIASMAGQILGARQGADVLPTDVICRIDAYDELMGLAADLAEVKFDARC